MKDFYTLGSAPTEEESVQVSPNVEYIIPMEAECRKYKEMLKKRFIHFNEVNFSIKSFLHDFGKYYEVVVIFDVNSNKANAQACAVEDHLPTTWDDEMIIDWHNLEADYLNPSLEY